MARGNTITINVVEARRTATISWRATGSSGKLVLSQEHGTIANAPLPSQASNAAYWGAVLNEVLPNLV